ncbi:hypothetical protein [Rhizobium leguminosarum]|uniref:hypothetical protein n=2 Tax=Rhizobium leguminosarum TaxID=384 RepID=UPI003F95EF09
MRWQRDSVLSVGYRTEGAALMTGGLSTLQSCLRRIREPLQAECRLIVPLSADNRMIDVVAVRLFAHEPISTAIGSRGRENIPDIALLVNAMDLRQYARRDGPAWYCRTAVSCVLPNRRGAFGSKSFEDLCRVCGRVRDTKNLPRV